MRRLTFSVFAVVPLLPLLAVTAAPASAAARKIDYTRWDSVAELRSGKLVGVRVGKGGRVALSPGARAGKWVSPWTRPGFALTELIASWEARTPGNSRVQIDVDRKSVV